MANGKHSTVFWIRRALYLLLLLAVIIKTILLILLFIACIRSLTFEDVAPFKKIKVDAAFKLNNESSLRYLEIFAKSLQFETVARAPGDYNKEELSNIQKYLKQSFPSVFNNSDVIVETVNNFSLLLSIQGSDKSIPPYMLCGHLDVVPVNPSLWDNPPFGGHIIKDLETGEDFVWGRGAIDVKPAVVGILSSLDVLFSRGWKPTRSFYVAFGHDEEVSGFDGAGHIAKVLTSRNVSLEFIFDEGIPIAKGVIELLEAPVNLICVTEKGRMDILVSANGTGGHSSFPPKDQAVQKLVKALDRIMENPHPSKFGSQLDRDMFEQLSMNVSFLYKVVMRNLWLFKPLVAYKLSLKSQSDALLRTTTAVTIMQGGYKVNVVPSTAWAKINHRIHPIETPEEVLAFDQSLVGDADVKLEIEEKVSALSISPYGPGTPYQLIAQAVYNVFPEVVSAPGVLLGNTDTRHYVGLSKNIYRMVPFILNPLELKTLHSHNERLSASNFIRGIEFYKTLILHAEDQPKSNLQRLFGEL